MLLRCYSTVTSASQVAACCSLKLQLLSQPFLRSGSQRSAARAYSNTSSTYNSTASSATTSSSLAGAEGTGSSSDPSSSTNALKQALDDQDRRGFGGRVTLPAEDVLRQQVLAGADKPVDLTLRSYHVGECAVTEVPMLQMVGNLSMEQTTSRQIILSTTFVWHALDCCAAAQQLPGCWRCFSALGMFGS